MADAASKVTVFFKGTQGPVAVGWTENWWTSQANLKTAVEKVIDDYVPKRKELIGVGAEIQAVRATSVPTTRLSYLQFITGDKDGKGVLFSSAEEDMVDPAQVDLLVRAQTADGHRRQFWIGGLPDSITRTQRNQGVSPRFISEPAIKQVFNVIKAIPFGIRWKSGAGPVYTFSPITELFPIMVRNRKRGRPFFPFHGRAAV
jgi:hypothetical protein